MMRRTFERRTRLEAPAEEVFGWHARPGALERLSPPWDPPVVESRTGGIEDAGARVVLRVGPLRQRWVAEHYAAVPGREFRDRRTGPTRSTAPMPVVVPRPKVAELRALTVVLGDQLDLEAAAFDGFDAGVDAVWMAEVAEESTQVWSSKARTALFLAAMRHFALALQAAGRPLQYSRLDAAGNCGSLGAQLHADIQRLRPSWLVMTAPGD